MRTLLASLFVLMLAFPATAAFEGPDAGASADSVDCQSCEVNTVARALRAADDTPCILEGLILSRLPHKEHYRFQDSSGVIPVYIDDELFAVSIATEAKVVEAMAKDGPPCPW